MINLIGLIGVVLVLAGYILLQIEYIKQSTPIFSWLNILGSICLIYSLWFNWNVASFTIEVAWLLISLFGLFRALKYKKI